MDCIKCGRKNTKYRCIGCKTSICNICSVACSVETPGYSEENYFVGKCDSCQASGCKQKVSEQPSASKPRQSSLTSFLKLKAQSKPADADSGRHPDAAKSKNDTPSTSCSVTSISGSSSVAEKKTRTLSVATANRWKAASLASYLGNEWLIINADAAGNVTSLSCSVCKHFADKVKGIKNFSSAWAFSGSTNLRLSNAEDHARGDPHKRAMDLHLAEDKGQCFAERAESMKDTNEGGQQLITTGIANMQAGDLAKAKVKFEVAYFIAKEELPLAKYPELLKLEAKHGVKIGKSYLNRISCNTFLKYISADLARKLEQKLTNANFFSVLTDGSEDASITEKEAVFVQYLDRKPSGRDTVKVTTAFLRLVELKFGTAPGIVNAIKNSFEAINITDDFNKKLIGFAADGATVNRGQREGVIGILNAKLPWVIYVWCLAHRLELSMKDALQHTCFNSVDDMLLRLYYLYENSPKKLRQLRDLHSLYGQTFEFDEGGIRPKRASGNVF